MAPHAGFVTASATRDIGLAVVELGGGRTRPDDKVDHAVGITRLLPVGAEVLPGRAAGAGPCALEGGSRTRRRSACFPPIAIGDAKPPAQKAVIRRISARRS